MALEISLEYRRRGVNFEKKKEKETITLKDSTLKLMIGWKVGLKNYKHFTLEFPLEKSS